MNIRFFAILLLLAFGYYTQAQQQKITQEQYIQTYYQTAIENMHSHGIPASITLAQGILESGNGNSKLAVKANNHFGIKCHSDWKGKTFHQDDDAKNECFRKYSNPSKSYSDHANFLKNKNRYAFLFELKITDYKGWAHGLKKAGYATNPKYPGLLINLIERNNLHQYDSPRKLAKSPKQKESSKQSSRKEVGIDLEAKTISLSSREVQKRNNIKYILAKREDTALKIATELDMMAWQIYKYNDLKKGSRLEQGQIIYLQPKRNKCSRKLHIAKSGDSLQSISQEYGIKLKQLIKKNPSLTTKKLIAGDQVMM